MKNIWKIYTVGAFDVLVSKTIESKTESPQLKFTICEQLGNEIYVALTLPDHDALDSAFEKCDQEVTERMAEYLIKTIAGQGIFEGDGPDQVDISHTTSISLQK